MTIKPLLRTTYKSKDGYPIVIRVIDGKQQKLFYTGYKVNENQWKNGQVKSHKDAAIINHHIDKLISKGKKYLAECKEQGRRPDINRLFSQNKATTFNEYLKKLGSFYRETGKIVTAKKLDRLELEISESFGTFYFNEITDISPYLVFIKKLHANTKAKKIADLRQYYNRAIKEGLAVTNPWQVKMQKVPTKKEKLTFDELDAFENVELTGESKTARDLFMLSYYCKGVRFENCVTLRREQIHDGRIFFRSNKGKVYLSVLIHPPLQKILDQYDGKDFVFPYLKEMPAPDKFRRVMDVINVQVNRGLKMAYAYAGIRKHVTFHIARHTTAHHLFIEDVPMGRIKNILGHSTETMTANYIASMNDEALDSAMDKIYKRRKKDSEG